MDAAFVLEELDYDVASHKVHFWLPKTQIRYVMMSQLFKKQLLNVSHAVTVVAAAAISFSGDEAAIHEAQTLTAIVNFPSKIHAQVFFLDRLTCNFLPHFFLTMAHNLNSTWGLNLYGKLPQQGKTFTS